MKACPSMWLLLADMEEKGWVVESRSLEPFTFINSKIVRAHGRASYILRITEPAATNHPASSTTEMLSHKFVCLSTSKSSPDYDRAPFT